MFCPACGTPSLPAAAFCARCGAALPGAAAATGPTAAGLAGSTLPPQAAAAPDLPLRADTAAYGGFWARFLAMLIDGLVLTPLVGVVHYPFWRDDGFTLVYLGHAKLASFLITWLYCSLMESGPYQATLGKLALGLQVTDLAGARLSWRNASGRHFAKLLSSLLCGLGYLLAAFTARHQALHDLLAGTLVLRRRAP